MACTTEELNFKVYLILMELTTCLIGAIFNSTDLPYFYRLEKF